MKNTQVPAGCYLTFNGWVCGARGERPAELLSTLLASIPDLRYWSRDCLVDLIRGVSIMVSEFVIQSGGSQAVAKRFMKHIAGQLQYFPKDQAKALNSVYEYILRGTGDGVLANFGMASKFGDNLGINPGYQRMSVKRI